MAQILKKLSESAVKNALRAGYYADGGGLYLQVSNVGTKSWVYRFSMAGRSREMGLGSVRDVPLLEARRKATEARLARDRGIDPIEARRAQETALEPRGNGAPLFREFTEQYVASREGDWKNEKHREQWHYTLEQFAYPVIGNLSVDAIETKHILQILEPIWGTIPETASRLRGRIERILAAASVRDLRQGNPAMWKGHLQEALPKKARAVSFPAMPYPEVPGFFAAVQRREGLGARALELTILTAVRSSESLCARWTEIDLAVGLWTIPADRMKAAREHCVPLSPAAAGLLKSIEPLRTDGDFVSPGLREKTPLSNMAMTNVLRSIGQKVATVHGFRSSFRDWCGDCTTFPREIAEAALAHTISDKTEAAYRRGTALQRRRELMQQWADFCLPNYQDETIGDSDAQNTATHDEAKEFDRKR